MATLVISIDLPPVGELETSGKGTSPTKAQMDEERQARQNFLDLITPFFELLPNRPLRRADNISRVELLGGDIVSQLNHYLLLVSVDIIAQLRIDQELSTMLPKGSKVSVVGDFDSLRTWEARSA